VTDIFLPGVPPAYTDWSYCVGVLELAGMDHANAEILAAIGGPESGYDYHVINDTPATGDYSAGVWQINYYGADGPARTAEFGTIRQLLAGGPVKQARAAYSICKAQGWLAWATTYTSGDWRQYIGSGPVPHPGQPPAGPPGRTPPVLLDTGALVKADKTMRQLSKDLIRQRNALQRVGVPGWRP